MLAYKIECARFSFRILQSSWKLLRSELDLVDQIAVSEDAAIAALSAAWQVVDFSARHLNVLRTIPIFPRKDERFRNLEKVGRLLTPVRNYIQHVDHETHKLMTAESYPILGAIAWSDFAGQSSTSLCVGTMPANTTFHTVAFDQMTGRYVDEVLLSVGSHTLSLTETYNSSFDAAKLMDEWLIEKEMLHPTELAPNVIHSSGRPNVESKLRFLRVKFTRGDIKTS